MCKHTCTTILLQETTNFELVVCRSHPPGRLDGAHVYNRRPEFNRPFLLAFNTRDVCLFSCLVVILHYKTVYYSMKYNTNTRYRTRWNK
jgi:hypothetical protein